MCDCTSDTYFVILILVSNVPPDTDRAWAGLEYHCKRPCPLASMEADPHLKVWSKRPPWALKSRCLARHWVREGEVLEWEAGTFQVQLDGGFDSIGYISWSLCEGLVFAWKWTSALLDATLCLIPVSKCQCSKNWLTERVVNSTDCPVQSFPLEEAADSFLADAYLEVSCQK